MKARVHVPPFLLTGAQLLLLAGASAGVFATSAYLAMRVAVFGSAVEVPRVLALESESARRLLAARELVLEETGTRHSQLYPAGQILSQQPPPGEHLKPGRKVKVLVSLGAEEFRAPQLIGMAVPRARVVLGQEGLRLGNVAHVHFSGQRENLVVAQDPPAGAGVEREGRVDLLVSRGSAEAASVMPDLVGLRLQEAQKLLDRHGFRVGNVKRRKDRGVPPGEVLRQSPLPGYPVLANDRIALVVSE